MLRNLIGQLIPFQHMLEAADLHAELLHQAQQHQDFILAIGVAVNQVPAFEDFTCGFEFEVTSGGGWTGETPVLLWPGIRVRR